jgi:protein gp37
MASTSQIEWTEVTWNPVTGCTKISQGCKFCYAERMARRLRAMRADRYRNGFDLTLHEDLLIAPLKWKRPRVVFVNSMSDLFHEDVPFEFIARAFDTMVNASQHTFQILTKRSGRLREIAGRLPWPLSGWGSAWRMGA